MTEPGAGSDVAGMKSRAEDQGDHWLLNGSKTYISNGQIADLVIVAARTVPEKRTASVCSSSRATWPASSADATARRSACKAQDTSELFFDNVKVPKANVLGDPTRGFYYLTQFLAEERLIAPCQCIANAQVALDLTLECHQRTAACSAGRSARSRTRASSMAEMRAQIDVLQTFIDHCVMQHSEGKLTPRIWPRKPSC